jgi:methylglutaconyl-CoA hydratase
MAQEEASAAPPLVVSRLRPGIAQVQMNRPERFNAFDETMIAALDATFAELEIAPDVRVVVLAGAGKHFSAGADVHWMQRASQASQAWNEADAQRFAAMLARIAQCAKPTVARVQGAALGGGAGLAAACDIVVAAHNAHFAISEARFGIVPAVIGPHLVNAIGARQARRLALSAERIEASEALQLGLVHHCVDVGELDTRLSQVCDDLLRAGPQAQREIKRLFATLGPGAVGPEVQAFTAQTIARVRGTAEAREGFAAFLVKRAPEWSPPSS